MRWSMIDWKKLGGGGAVGLGVFFLFHDMGEAKKAISILERNMAVVHRLERKFDVYVAVEGSERAKAAVKSVEDEPRDYRDKLKEQE